MCSCKRQEHSHTHTHTPLPLTYNTLRTYHAHTWAMALEIDSRETKVTYRQRETLTAGETLTRGKEKQSKPEADVLSKQVKPPSEAGR